MRSELYESLRLKMESAGFVFAREQRPHSQSRQEMELVFHHPILLEKLSGIGHQVRGKNFYIKPLSDSQDCEVGLVNGSTSPLLTDSRFPASNAIDTHHDIPAWVNRPGEETLDGLLAAVGLLCGITSPENEPGTPAQRGRLNRAATPRAPRYWWVNQNQTGRQEISGGYMWSPKRKRNGGRSQFYENMRECAPGDVVFSFVDTRISNVGIVTSFCEEAARPGEFGTTGDQWDEDGWRVNVRYHPLPTAVRPAEHMTTLGPTLPNRYSPLQPDGRGNQVYLASVPKPMADELLRLMGDAAGAIVSSPQVVGAESLPFPASTNARDEAIEERVRQDSTLTETEKQTIVNARRGQGLFRQRVAAIEPHCRVTGVTNEAYRIASHIKPWRHCDNEERLDGSNGLLLAPHIDLLFDGGLISFAENGDLLISPAADIDSLKKMGLPVGEDFNVGSFNERQRRYLDFHRREVFKAASN